MCFVHSLFGNFNLLRRRWQSRHHSNDESRDRIVVFWNPTSLSKNIFSSSVWDTDDVEVRKDSDVSLKHTIRLRYFVVTFWICHLVPLTEKKKSILARKEGSHLFVNRFRKRFKQWAINCSKIRLLYFIYFIQTFSGVFKVFCKHD